jgi:hypothetical protein
MRYFTKHYLFLLCACMALQGYAQGGRGIVLRLADSVTDVHNEELKDVTIAVENKSNVTFNGTLRLYCGKGARVATKQDLPVKVEPGKSLFVSAKVYIGASTLAGKIPYSAQLFDPQRTKVAEAGAMLQLTGNKLMQASLPETELIMPAAGQTISVPVLVRNRGNIAQEVNVVIAYPVELHDQVNKSIKVTVPPFRDTTLYFTRKVTRAMINLEYLDISMYGIYASGDYFGIASASVQRIKSKKRYGRKVLNGYGDRGGNYVSVGTQNTFSDNESYFLQAKGDYAVGNNSNLAFSLNIYKWKNTAMPTLINDTWLAFEHKQVGFRLGNIIQNGELSYNGRGAEAYYYTDSLKKTKIYTGYLDKSFNLFNNKNGNTSFGRAAWAGLSREMGRVRNNTMVSYDEDKYANTRSVLLVNDATWRLSELLFAAAKVGLANSVASGESDEKHQSFSVGGSINGNLTKVLSISSDNLFASGYYPGTRKGTLALNERLSLRLGKTTLGAGYMYNYLNPEYFLNGGTPFRNNSKGSTAELSVARPLGDLNLSLAAQYYHEEGNWFYNGSTLPGSTDAYRLSLGVAFADKYSRQNLMFKADAGRYSASFMQQEQWQFRANFSYAYRFFRLTANVQKGNFYLSEVFQEFTGGKNDVRLNISPALSYSFFNHRLKMDAGLTYYKDFYVSSILYNAAVNCNLGSTQLFATLQYNTFASSTSYRNIQFGLTQLLPQSGREMLHNKGSIDLFVFYDNNGNGVFDKEETPAPDYLASFDKTLLVTGKDGKASYSKLPAGHYKVYFPTQRGWYGTDQLIVLGEKETTHLDIPLRQTGTISGSIAYEFDEVLSYATAMDLAGQSITATNSEGKTFEARTDDNGRYILYVPSGEYTLTVSSVPAQIEVLNEGGYKQPLPVGPGEIVTSIDFKLKVKQRKIEVKKFGQQ